MKKKIFTLLLIISFITILVIQNFSAEEKKIVGKNWDDPNGWNCFDDQKSKIKLELAKDTGADVLKATYSLGGIGSWVVMIKSIKNLPSLNTPIILNIKAKANSTLEIKMLDKDGSVFGTKKNLTNNFKDWTQIVISLDELSYWWGGDEKFDQAKEFQLAFSGNGSGTVLFKNIGYGEPIDATNSAPISNIWDSLTLWDSGADDAGSILTLSEDKGKIDKAIKISYQIKKDGGYVFISKGIKTYISKDNPFAFYIKAAAEATLEIKFIDKDGSVFGTKLTLKDKYKDWTLVTLTQDDVEYWWGGDEKFDQPKELGIAIAGLKGSKGTVLLNQIGFNTIKE